MYENLSGYEPDDEPMPMNMLEDICDGNSILPDHKQDLGAP